MKSLSDALVGLMMLLWCLFVVPTLAAAKPPNIVILFADDQGWGDLGAYGHPVLQTPALDWLAEEGCRFTNFYASAPVCSPSRAGLLTGRIQNRFGMDHIINRDDDIIPIFHHLPPEEPTIPRILRETGYATYHVGKWHLSFMGHKGEPTFDAYGFDQALLLGAGRYNSYYESFWTRFPEGGRSQAKSRWSADIYVEEAIKLIESNPDKPFFLNLWSFAPHIQVEASPEFMARYPGRTLEEQQYFGAITQMDAAYGRLLDYLDESGLTENTIVIFSSDNGCTSPLLPWVERSRGRAPLRGSKHNLGEAGIKVPGIIRWPGVTAPGTVSHVPVSTLDLMPTLVAAAGAELPEEWEFDGGNLRPAFEGRPVERPHPLYWQFRAVSLMEKQSPPHRSLPLALRDGPWKLMTNEAFEAIELYNLDTDPSEKWNMAEIYPEITARLMDQIRLVYAEVNGAYSKTANYLNPHFLNKGESDHGQEHD